MTFDSVSVPIMNRIVHCSRGDSVAADQLLPLVYDELRRLAGKEMAHEEAAGLTGDFSGDRGTPLEFWSRVAAEGN